MSSLLSTESGGVAQTADEGAGTMVDNVDEVDGMSWPVSRLGDEVPVTGEPMWPEWDGGDGVLKVACCCA